MTLQSFWFVFMLLANFVVGLCSFFWAAVLHICVQRGISQRLSVLLLFSVSFVWFRVVLVDFENWKLNLKIENCYRKYFVGIYYWVYCFKTFNFLDDTTYLDLVIAIFVFSVFAIFRFWPFEKSIGIKFFKSYIFDPSFFVSFWS